MTHRCEAAACPTEIPRGKFMCPAHWRMVPVALQNTINSRYRACRADCAFLRDAAYLQACVDAIEHIARREGIQGVNGSYHRLLRLASREVAS